jgi:hypothetical protein
VGEGGVASRNHDCRARKRGKAEGVRNNQIITQKGRARQRRPIPLAVEKCQNFLAWNFGGSPTKIRDYELNNRISDSYKILILDIRIFNIQHIKILPPSFLIYLYIFAELKTPPCNYISITITKLGDKFLIYSISGIFKYDYKFWLLL